MLLLSDDYTFWATSSASMWDDSFTILIGNPRGRPKPCVSLSIDERRREIVLQDLTYYSTCSSPKQ